MTRTPSRYLLGAAALTLTVGLSAAPDQTPVGTPPQQQQQPPPAQGRAGGGGGGRGQTRDQTTPSVVGTGTISGAVVLEGTGTGVRRARVTLSGTELRGGRSAITDDQGRFTFTALPAGRFTMTAAKAGFVDIAYGAKRSGRPGTPIQLSDGQKIEKAVIALPRGSVVTGVVIDETGEPSPGTRVRVMRYVIRTGERSLSSAGEDTTDDRGMYRVYGLQPGEYMISAVPRNASLGDLRQTIQAEVESLQQQLQAQGVTTTGGRGGRQGGGELLGQIGAPGGRGGGQQILDRVTQLQQQLTQADQEQSLGYAPVYYPGTTAPSSASSITLGIGEERSGVDFRLQLVQTAKIEGQIVSPDGSMPQGTQVSLVPSDRGGVSAIPGVGMSMTRVNQGGQFSFTNVAPGQYSLQARAAIRTQDPNAQAAVGRAAGPGRGGQDFGPGGRGGQVAQVLWAAMDISVTGQPLQNLVLNLQPGMRISGRIDFQGTTSQPPADLTRVRISLAPRGSQGFEMGGIPPAVVDAQGRFTITGVAPGRYMISAAAPIGGGANQGQASQGMGRGGGPANPAAGQWSLKSAIVNGLDVLDFPLEIAPNQEVSNAVLTFADRTQELSGTIQDSQGRPSSDYTIIVYPSDNRFWLPSARRIVSTRPGTDGKFTLRNLPPGDYRLTAVTDVEPGEWFDPNFLGQLATASIAIQIGEGEKKVQDLRVGGGH